MNDSNAWNMFMWYFLLSSLSFGMRFFFLFVVLLLKGEWKHITHMVSVRRYMNHESYASSSWHECECVRVWVRSICRLYGKYDEYKKFPIGLKCSSGLKTPSIIHFFTWKKIVTNLSKMVTDAASFCRFQFYSIFWLSNELILWSVLACLFKACKNGICMKM